MKQFTFKTFLILTFFVAATALALSLKVLQSPPAENNPVSLKDEIRALEERIDQLASAIDQTRPGESREDRAAPVAPDLPAAVASSNREPATEARLRELSESMNEVRWTMSLRGMAPPTAGHIERARGLLEDPGTDLRTRLAGLRLLRIADALTDDDVRQVVAQLEQTDDPGTQAAMIRMLDGVRTPEFLDTLIHVSSTSDNPRVRREAVDSLSGYLPDPDLKEWLELVARDDPDGRVKREASRLLSRHWPAPE